MISRCLKTKIYFRQADVQGDAQPNGEEASHTQQSDPLQDLFSKAYVIFFWKK